MLTNITENIYYNGNNSFVNPELAPINRILLLVDQTTQWIQLISAILSFLFNAMVLYGYGKHKVIHVKKLLIIILSIVDLTYALSQVFVIHRRFNNHQWIFGLEICKLTVMSSASITSSIYIILLIAIERHQTIMYPFKGHISKRQLSFSVLFILTLSLAFQIPALINLKITNFNTHEDCANVWSSVESVYWDIFLFIFSFVVPVFMLLGYYSRIYVKVKHRHKNTLFRCSKVLSRKQKQANKQRKMVCLLSAIILAFLITTTPNQVQILWFALSDFNNPNSKTVFAIFHGLSSLVHMHSFVNPIIYSICDSRFRNIFLSSKKPYRTYTSILSTKT